MVDVHGFELAQVLPPSTDLDTHSPTK